MIDLDTIINDLKTSPIGDPGHRLKPGGRREIEDAIQRFKTSEREAHVVVLDAGDVPAEAKALWDKLGYDEHKDLLLITNGKTWEVRGWSLTRAQIDEAMAHGAIGFKQYLGKGIEMSLEALEGQVTGRKAAKDDKAPSSPPPKPADEGGSSGTWIGLGVGGAVVVGLVAFAIRRRNQRAGEARGEFDKARASAERAYTDLILACEELGGETGSELQLKATELKKRLDAVVAEADGKPDRMNDRVVIGKITQLESELAALRSTQLQKARG